ncbi:MAG: glycosyltransferase family 4 protein [Winogradskyella sp.]|uniref:glycosyltransferase family 4 protein n=1 Tax=Winogradskyella sp. TaxID=1883156 RepID=UPI0025E9AD02|nr:glycosyltransferase family 4 protein [Winogradskyella sp.]NRB59546.1 glycosyltransferase family 4 protein [Winogradskyella sp.]
MKTILYIHQAAELYGSDKTLLDLVQAIDKKPGFNVIVILPNDGPLKSLLIKNGIKVLTLPVIKISREVFKPHKLIALLFSIYPLCKRLKKALGETTIDIVHSNTLAVLLGAFYAKFNGIKHVWHVHEIIRKPDVVKNAYPLIVNYFSDKVVFNSKASMNFLTENNEGLKKISQVNLNAVSREKDFLDKNKRHQIRQELFYATEENIVLGLVGRISKWKGQDLLLKAFSELNQNYPSLKLVFVGSAPPNQEYLVEALNKQIKTLKLEYSCKIVPFQEEIWPVWDAIDVGVIPSKEPEPFGLVALEAMLSKKPLIVAEHGGLLEIVKDGETGYFFKPNDIISLKNTIEKLVTNEAALLSFGEAGYKRANKFFSIDKHIHSFVEIYENLEDKK